MEYTHGKTLKAIQSLVACLVAETFSRTSRNFLTYSQRVDVYEPEGTLRNTDSLSIHG